MKVRHGFVSNSSSSSFILEAPITEVIERMYKIVDVDYEEWGTPDEDNVGNDWRQKQRANLKKILSLPAIKNGKIGFTMPSCNYDTWIFQKDGKCYVETCNNHDWCLDDISGKYFGEDPPDDMHDIIKSAKYINVRNMMQHSYQNYCWDWGEDNTAKEYDFGTCKKCNHKPYSFVIDKDNNKICATCFEYVLEKGIPDKGDLIHIF